MGNLERKQTLDWTGKSVKNLLDKKITYLKGCAASTWGKTSPKSHSTHNWITELFCLLVMQNFIVTPRIWPHLNTAKEAIQM